MIWVLFSLMTIVALALPVIAVLRKRDRQNDRNAGDIRLYRRQLDDLEADLARGLMSSDDAQAARLEIQRRILKTATTNPADTLIATGPLKPVMAGLVLIVLLAWPLYHRLGAPNVPSLKAPPSVAQTTPGMDGKNMAVLLDELEAQLAITPERLDGWLLLGKTALGVEQPSRAVRAYRGALELAPDDAAIHASLGEALVLVAEGKVTPAADLAFSRTLNRDPQNAMALYYVGLGLLQNNRPDEALERWQHLLDITPDDAPWRAGISERVAGLQALVARRNATIAPRTLDQTELSAAADMSADDRQAMIEGMVARLAQRLEDNPNDLDGWLRLANAYRVMERPNDERRALQKARALADSEQIPTIDQRLSQLGT